MAGIARRRDRRRRHRRSPEAAPGRSSASSSRSSPSRRVLLWIFSPWSPRSASRRRSLRELGGFSGQRLRHADPLLSRTATLDNMLIGRFLGRAGARRVRAGVQRDAVAVQPASRGRSQRCSSRRSRAIQDDLARMRAMWLRVNRFVGAITVPAMFGPGRSSRPTSCPSSSATRWDSTQCRSSRSSRRSGCSSRCSAELQHPPGRDRPGWCPARYSIVALALSIVALRRRPPLGDRRRRGRLRHGEHFIEPYYTLLTCRALDLRFRDAVRNLSGVFQAAGGMLVCVLALRSVLPDVGDAARLVILIGAGVFSYAAFCAWRAPDLFAEARRLRRRRGRAEVEPVPGTP